MCAFKNNVTDFISTNMSPLQIYPLILLSCIFKKAKTQIREETKQSE